ncbi:Voltage-gated sodium channel subunit [Caenispirillum salinarum AK4]|uniref:Voltage-gated sodium channel subunit n=1 Tax=Caenispirillum salinarum AK4 TaxID=1238182 RepID=K9HUH7_9PROT|nr:ion transporter [Caenispirillum salinarum]EKV31906.1 Voltage-gated sodium channel subunit [Caenispirillum salinarum AK4]
MAEESAAWRQRVRGFVEAPRVQRFILVLIVINAVILGLETSSAVMEAIGPTLIAIDTVILWIFVAEITLRITAHGWRFFRDPWGVFDFIVVGIALVPQTGPFSVLRALRVLRVLRVISAVPRMRRVVTALLSAIPGLGSIIALLALVFYVAGVMATKLFGASFPDWFGTLPESVYTLFQVMTLESWSMGIVRPVMEVYPYAWAFFVPFIAIATFTMLNLFIAVVVNAMQSDYHETQEAAEATAHAEREEMLDHIRALRTEMAELREALGKRERSAGE